MKKHQKFQSISNCRNSVILFGIVIFCFLSCAKIGSLSGGDKDTRPPRIDSLQSDINYSTNFTQRSFELVFDEWINLKNKSQIITSPPLRYTPSITAKGKTIQFELDDRDTLKSNTTYVIQFGTSIVDFTEGNDVKNYNFVFSTGNIIDSLTLNGNIKDAYTGDNLEGITVMLYDQYQDSIVYKERPYYVASSNKNGHFYFKNLRPGMYKIIALSDDNNNYLFNPGNEKIGFLDSLIRIDSISQNLSILVFQEQLPIKFVDIIQPSIGFINLIFNQPAQDISFNFSKSFDYQKIISGDTISIWHQLDSIVDVDLYVLGDTISVKDIRKEAANIQTTLSDKTKEIHPKSDLTIPFNKPIFDIDTSLFTLLDTALQSIPFSIVVDTNYQNKIFVKSKWKEDQSYTLNALPGAIIDFNNNKTDSISIDFNVLNISKFGSIILNLSKLDSNYSYIVNLLLNKEIVESLFVSKNNSEYQHTFTKLIAGDYNFEIIEDRNNDKKWSSGNYLLKKHPEIIKFNPAGKLRENWDLNVELEFLKTKENAITKEIENEHIDDKPDNINPRKSKK